jgi:hypothetical protein
MNLNPTVSGACEATRNISATATATLKTAIEQGKAPVSAWRLSDEIVVRWHAESDVGCGCGCVPIE